MVSISVTPVVSRLVRLSPVARPERLGIYTAVRPSVKAAASLRREKTRVRNATAADSVKLLRHAARHTLPQSANPQTECSDRADPAPGPRCAGSASDACGRRCAPRWCRHRWSDRRRRLFRRSDTRCPQKPRWVHRIYQDAGEISKRKVAAAAPPMIPTVMR